MENEILSGPVAPVDRLPNEILLKIFSLAACGSRPSQLMSVSRRWCELAKRYHDLWRGIVFQPEKLEFADVCLQRSGNKPLSIYISDDKSSQIPRDEIEWQLQFNTFLKSILSHKHRWQYLQIKNGAAEKDYRPYQVPNRITKRSAPFLPFSFREAFCSQSLDTLTFDGCMITMNPNHSFWGSLLAESATRFPNLRVLSLDNFIPSFPQSAEAIRSVTTLDLSHGRHYTPMDVELKAFASVLQKLPGLQELSISVGHLNLTYGPGYKDPTIPIIFPDLVLLNITVSHSDDDEVEEFCHFLSFYRFPSVKTLLLDLEIIVSTDRWTIDLFKTNNDFPSLETLDLKLALVDQLRHNLQVIEIPIEKTPSIKKFSFYINTVTDPVEIILGEGLGRPDVRFPALQYLEVHADWNEGPDPQDYARKWIASVVREMKAHGTWDSFERLCVMLRQEESETRVKCSPGCLSVYSFLGDYRAEKVEYSRKEVEELLKYTDLSRCTCRICSRIRKLS